MRYDLLERVVVLNLEQQLVVRAPLGAEPLLLRPRHPGQVVVVRLPDARLRVLLVLLVVLGRDNARNHERYLFSGEFVLSHLFN